MSEQGRFCYARLSLRAEIDLAQMRPDGRRACRMGQSTGEVHRVSTVNRRGGPSDPITTTVVVIGPSLHPDTRQQWRSRGRKRTR